MPDNGTTRPVLGSEEQDEEQGNVELLRGPGSRVVGVRWHERTYRLDGLRPEDLLALQEHLASLRRDPLAAVREQLARAGDDPRLIELLADRAYRDLRRPRDLPSREEVAAWLDTPEGAARSTWLQVRRHHPDFTLEEAVQMVHDVTLAIMLQARDQATFAPDGRADGRNDTLPTPNTVPRANQSVGKAV